MLQRGFSLSNLPSSNNNNNNNNNDFSPRHTTLPTYCNSSNNNNVAQQLLQQQQQFQQQLQQTQQQLKISSSRYEEDFCEMERVGKGAHGSVYKVANRLDGEFYALKKIPFKNTTKTFLDKVLREVKTLASLNHRNIVRYHSAWLETDDLSTIVSSSSLSSSNKSIQTHSFKETNLIYDGATETDDISTLNNNDNDNSNSHNNNISYSNNNNNRKKKYNNLNRKLKKSQKKQQDSEDDEDDSLYRLQFPHDDFKQFNRASSIRESIYSSNITNNNSSMDDSEDSADVNSTMKGFFKTPRKHYSSFSLDDFSEGGGDNNTNGTAHDESEIQFSSAGEQDDESEESTDHDEDDESEEDSQSDSDYSGIFENNNQHYHHNNQYNNHHNDLIPNPLIPTSTTPPISMPLKSPLNNSGNNKNTNTNNNNRLKQPTPSLTSTNNLSPKVNKVTQLFIVMQLYSQTLTQWLENRAPDQVNEEENLNIFKQICIGLRYIHSKGIIHRDLKPGNIFLVREEDNSHHDSINLSSSSFEGGTGENLDAGGLLVALGDFGLAVSNAQYSLTTPSPTPTSTPSLTPVNLSSISPIDQILNINLQLQQQQIINNNNGGGSGNLINPLNSSTNSSNTTNSLSSSSSSTILTPPILSVQQQQQNTTITTNVTTTITTNVATTNVTTNATPSSSLSSSSTTPTVSAGTSLSRSLEHCKHTSAVGTLTYSSPEQKKGLYNEKTDIYSLGIILFELYFPISTRMEKARVLTDLRNGILPKSFLTKYPKVSELILATMRINPDERPSASDILKSEIFGQVLSVPEMESIIKHQQSLIELLKQEIYSLKSPTIPPVNQQPTAITIPSSAVTIIPPSPQ